MSLTAFPNGLQLFQETSKNYSIPSPSSVLRLSRNTGSGQFFGEKYKIEKVSPARIHCPWKWNDLCQVFEDNGNIASAATSAVWDYKSKNMYLSGMSQFFYKTPFSHYRRSNYRVYFFSRFNLQD